MKLREKVSWLMGRLQQQLFPCLEECSISPLTEQEKHLVKIFELIRAENHIHFSRQCMGRPPAERKAIARCFVAKAVFRYPSTRNLIHELKARPNLRLICGFARQCDIPSESTFSRVFAEFAESNLATLVNDAMVEEYLSEELIGHVSRDSTAVKGREKAARKIKKVKVPRKRGRPAKGEDRPPPEPKRIEVQLEQTAEEAIAALPQLCDRGTKKNSKGYKQSWTGYKLHVDVNDVGFPLSAVLTSASVHDSQVAIPLIKMTSAKVHYCYDLMDAAYDAEQIWKQSRELGHVPIIDRNPRRNDAVPMAPHEARRYNERSAAERFNGRLKEEFGGRNVMVRGAKKVMLHLMFGVISLFADHLLKLDAY
jgi:hypothetical protein